MRLSIKFGSRKAHSRSELLTGVRRIRRRVARGGKGGQEAERRGVRTMGGGGALPFVVSGPQDWDWLSLHTPHHLKAGGVQAG